MSHLQSFLIERTIPGVSEWSAETRHDVAKKSVDVMNKLREEGTQYEWIGSVVTGPDTLVCHHLAPSEAAVRKHSEMGSFPVDSVILGSSLPEGSKLLGPADATSVMD